MNDDKQILSTKLSIGDYNTFLILTKLEYQAGLIKEESTSELLRFTILHILNQLCNDQIYPYLEQEQQQEQKKAQNNQQQQLVNQCTLRHDTASHNHHRAPKLYQTSNL